MSALDTAIARQPALRRPVGSETLTIPKLDTGPKADTGKRKRRPPSGSSVSPGRLPIALLTAASLIWIGQAALLAAAIGDIAAGAGAGAVIWPAVGVFLLGVLRAAMDRAGSRLAFRAARHELSRLREKAVSALATRSPLDTSRPSSGFVASAMAEQAEAVTPYVSRFQPLRWRAVIVPLAIFACVFPLSWVAALIMLIALPLIPVFMALIGWRAKEASERQLAKMGDMNAFLLDRLRGLATIRSFDAVDRTALRLRDEADLLRRRTMAVLRIAFLSSAVLELFSALGVAMVAVYVGFHFLGQLEFGAWGGRLSLAQGVFILMLAPAFFEPMRELSAVWHDRAAGVAALEALEKVTTAGEPIVAAREAPMAKPGGRRASGVLIDDLHFRHAGSGHAAKDRKVFDGLSLHIEPGERVAVMAASGGGKSTLLALIAGLAMPEAGTIRIGGETLQPETAARLRAGMAWLGQTPHVFPGTLAGNVTLGRAMTAGAVEAALDAARLDEVARQRRRMVLGESGVGLSGGEVLRLAVARAAAAEGAGLVLADEPTAHLDRASADEITDMLLEVANGRTLIVATHDPVLAARMDRVVMLDDRNAGGWPA
ncbi:ATP-binding cassette subfamily C protein CydD [Aquamicrobium ahrensii]|uniref:ATP-binding cassette subfamily C protein CydD n=1 Tax=Aquamicrobium ahrensii TaxID=469551 RepID=A0ABV2KMM0_9HYPH